jgi:hypothetical protein
LTIVGTGFTSDGLGGEVSVTVGEDECEIESMTPTQIFCRTIPFHGESEIYAGNRGAKVTVSTTENMANFVNLDGVISKSKSSFEETDLIETVAKSEFLFISPFDGFYSFVLTSNAQATLNGTYDGTNEILGSIEQCVAEDTNCASPKYPFSTSSNSFYLSKGGCL